MDAVIKKGADERRARKEPLPELAVVRLKRDVEDEGRLFAAGSVGTIVDVQEPGVAYIVELYDGTYWIPLVYASDLELASEPV